MKNKLLILVVSVAIAFLSSGCSKIEKPPMPEKNESRVLFEDTKNIDFDIYIDSTVSMYGFAASDITTAYVSTIASIPGVASGLSGTLGKVRYHSFGEEIVDIVQEQFVNARKQDFYTQKSANNRKTNIAGVVKKICDDFEKGGTVTAGKSGKISLIITDLFEDNSNVDPLISSIKKSFNNAELSIGVLGIRSYFKGEVFDMGRNTKGTPYESDGKNIKTYRPFYILVLGKINDITRFYENLNKVGLGALPAGSSYFEVYSKHSVIRQGEIEGDTQVMAPDMQKPRIKEDGEFTKEIQDPRVKALKVYIGGISENEKVNETITSIISIAPTAHSRLKYAIDTGKNVFEGKTDALLSSEATLQSFAEGAFTDVQDVSGCLIESKVALDHGRIKSEIVLNPYALKEGYYRISLLVQYDHDMLTPVIPEDWNMKDEHDPMFGCKTIYLYNLLEGLHGLTKEFKQPLAQVYYYLKVIK